MYYIDIYLGRSAGRGAHLVKDTYSTYYLYTYAEIELRIL